MKFWNLNESDIDRIALGVGILGTGGGGSPYLASLMVKAQLRQGREIKIVRPADLPPDSMVLPLGAIGAPTVGIEKIEEGSEGVRMIHAMEKLIGRRIDAVIADEIGGGNGLAPMITAAKLGLPVVDADGMGRAFPEVQMTTFFINGQSTAPTVLADACGNVVVVSQVTSPEMLEKLMRAGTVVMGCEAYMATAPMNGDFVSRFGVPHTISQSWRLGDTVLNARSKKTDPVGAVIEREGGTLLLQGKVVDIARRIDGGFVRGELTVAGLGAFSGRSLQVDIQNEYLVAREEGRILSMVPDLISIMDSETGRPIATEEQRYGLRVSVVAIPAPALLRTELALASVGPRAFGYDFDFVPLGQPTVARPVDAYARTIKSSTNEKSGARKGLQEGGL